MNRRFVSRLGLIAIMGGLHGVGAASASAQCLADEIQKLTASNGSLGDHFGTSVTILGEMALVGATAGNGAENGTGAAYVYRFDPVTWQWNEQQILAALDGFWPDAFGISVAINPIDPNVVIVGAYLDDDNGGNSGSAYVFRYNPDSRLWAQEQKLTAWDGDALDRFGWSVAVWGNVAMIGALLDDDPEQDIGSVYVFGYDAPSETWVQQQKLIPSDTQFHGRFGSSVSLQGDVVLIGATSDSEQSDSAGAAYVFGYDPNTQTWLEQQKFHAADAAAGNSFGWSASLDGDTALIGAHHGAAPPVFNTGAAYVFRFDGRQWVQEQKLTASDAAIEDFFGWSVSLSGNIAVIGAALADDGGESSGAAFLFNYHEGQWTQKANLLSSDIETGDVFGISVSTDGQRAIVGANFDDDDGSESGSAYVFGGLGDCNENGELDLCDIADEFSSDKNNNGIPDECEPPLGDLDGDGVVGASDLLLLLTNWGRCAECGDCPADLSGDCTVGAADLLILLANWG